jgi:RNA polymerase sigma factor (sigma-70 family)
MGRDVELTIKDKRSRQSGSDAELVVRCIRGDQRAWEQLVAKYERLIFSIGIAICRDSEVASDILQQVCLELYQRLDEVRNVDSLAAWLATVTRRKTFTYLRSTRPTEPFTEDDEDGAVSPDLIANIERQHTLERALATLPPRSRRLIELLYFSNEEKSYEDIAAELGIPVASIGPTRVRCLEKLRKFLA